MYGDVDQEQNLTGQIAAKMMPDYGDEAGVLRTLIASNSSSGDYKKLTQQRIAEKGLNSELTSIVKPIDDKINALNTVNEALEVGSYGQIQSVLPTLTRLAGDVGNIAEKEQMRQFFETLSTKFGSFKAKLLNSPGDKIPEENLNMLKERVNYLKGALSKTYTEKLNTYKKRQKAAKSLKQLDIDIDGFVDPEIEKIKFSLGDNTNIKNNNLMDIDTNSLDEEMKKRGL
jgi:hypothetical protein